MKRTVLTVLMLVLAGGLAALHAQSSNKPTSAGYIEFGELEVFKTHEPEVEISIDQDLLQIVSAGIEDSNVEGEAAEFAQQVANLELIKVYTFSIDESERASVSGQLKTVYRQLEEGQWKTVVKVQKKKGGEEVRIAYKKSGDLIDGIVVISMGKKNELVLVNIVGHLDLRFIGQLSKKFNMGIPNDADKGGDTD